MEKIEKNPVLPTNLRQRPQEIAVFNGFLRNPELIGSFPHLQAWGEFVGKMETLVPSGLSKEDTYRKLEAETTKQIAGFIAFSSAIIVDKLGAPGEGFGLPFVERMQSFIDTAQGSGTSRPEMCRKEAEVFIEEALNFISDLPNAKDDPLELRKMLIDFMFGQYRNLNRDNNLSIQGGMALFALALPKRSFNDHKDVRGKLIETVKKDYTAWKIYKSFEKDLFRGQAYQLEDEAVELKEGAQASLSRSPVSAFDYFGGFKGFESGVEEEKTEIQLRQEELERMADEFLASHK